MRTFHHTVDIAATPERVWEVLGDLTSVDKWIPGVASVVRTDDGRACTFEDGRVQQEKILDYSPEARSYRYVIDGAPLPVKDNTGKFSVHDASGHARVVWESSFVALDPSTESEVAQMWEPYLPAILGNLKALVENH